MILRSKRIYFDDGMRSGFLFVEDGKFTKFRSHINADDYIDLGSDRVIPGIFDTHNHGTCGYSFLGSGKEDISSDEVQGCLKGLASQGVTNVFPTVVSPAAIKTIAETAKLKPTGATILGIHSEGPWLNRVGEKGTRTPWPAVSKETSEKMVEDGQGMLKLVALAPEIPEIDPIIQFFLNQGITVACAHSDCNYRQAMEAYGKGLSVATHTGNVMVGMHHRNVGGLGAALLNDTVDCEVICDGMHICPEMLEIYFRIKNPSRFMMISDCTPFSGAPAGQYHASNMQMNMNVTQDGFVLTDTGRLCGSSQPVLFGIKNLVEKVKIPIETAIKMASLNPCVKYGFAKEKGSIKLGKDADFVVITDDYHVKYTYVNGTKVYDSSLDGKIFNPHFLDKWRYSS